MSLFRYPLKTDWPFYLLVIGYLYTLGRMTLALWFGDGVNIFATYSDVTLQSAVVLDANKVYWAKSGFLFTSLLLISLRFDVRAAFGLAATFWASAVILMFGVTTVPILASLLNGVILVGLQIYRKALFVTIADKKAPQSTASGYHKSQNLA